jgi:hypothetical protein
MLNPSSKPDKISKNLFKSSEFPLNFDLSDVISSKLVLPKIRAMNVGMSIVNSIS